MRHPVRRAETQRDPPGLARRGGAGDVSGEADGEVRPPSAFDRARQVDAWCDRFEADWKGGGRPRIEDYQGAAQGPLHADLIPELVALEVALRREAGESPDPDDYRRRFPGQDGWLDAALGLGAEIAAGDPTVRELAALARELLGGPGGESDATLS